MAEYIIPLAKVNQFLPMGKLQVEPEQRVVWLSDLEKTAKETVFAKLRPVYDVSLWETVAVTPPLVVDIIGMLTAGWLYDRQFAEEAVTGLSYGTRKVREAYALLDGILEGMYIIDAEVIADLTKLPSTLITEPVFLMGERH